MALTAGTYVSGGDVRDTDDRRVVAVESVGGGAVAVSGSFSASPQTASALAGGSTTATAGASAALIASNGSRKGLQVVLDTAATAPVYLLLGAGTASATNFHVALAAGGSWDGLVGQALWTGAVQVFSTAGGKVGVAEV